MEFNYLGRQDYLALDTLFNACASAVFSSPPYGLVNTELIGCSVPCMHKRFSVRVTHVPSCVGV